MTDTIDEKQEEQMVHLVRNTLLVAGQEMGSGDHWPVVKSTIYSIMQDWEDLKTERNVHIELRRHLGEQLRIMEDELPKCGPDAQAVLGPKIKEFREIYDAHFTDLDKNAIVYDTEQVPEHIKRMNAIISTLEGENDE